VTARVVDQQGVLVPDADQLIHFQVKGVGFIAGTDNGNEIDHNSLKSRTVRLFMGWRCWWCNRTGRKEILKSRLRQMVYKQPTFKSQHNKHHP